MPFFEPNSLGEASAGLCMASAGRSLVFCAHEPGGGQQASGKLALPTWVRCWLERQPGLLDDEAFCLFLLNLGKWDRLSELSLCTLHWRPAVLAAVPAGGFSLALRFPLHMSLDLSAPGAGGGTWGQSRACSPKHSPGGAAIAVGSKEPAPWPLGTRSWHKVTFLPPLVSQIRVQQG